MNMSEMMLSEGEQLVLRDASAAGIGLSIGFSAYTGVRMLFAAAGEAAANTITGPMGPVVATAVKAAGIPTALGVGYVAGAKAYKLLAPGSAQRT